MDNQAVDSILQQFDHSVIERVLVLLEPAGQVVGDGASIVDNGKVGILVRFGRSLGKVGGFSKVVALQLVLKGLVSGLGEEGFLLKDGQDSHRLLEHGDARLEIHSKVDHGPINALLNVLLLLKYKHVVVEELLKLLIAEVDANLLKSIVLQMSERKNNGMVSG